MTEAAVLKCGIRTLYVVDPTGRLRGLVTLAELARPVASRREPGARAGAAAPRQRVILEETDFDEVPAKYRRFYRRWSGPGDALAANEVLGPVCRVVVRSTRELRTGARVYCMPCMSRLVVVKGSDGRQARVAY